MRKNSIFMVLVSSGSRFWNDSNLPPNNFFFFSFSVSIWRDCFSKILFWLKNFFLLFWLFCEQKVHWGSRITSSIQRSRSSPGWRTTFHFRFLFFLEKFKFKLFSAHNNCNCGVRVQNIFSKILILAFQQKKFSVNLSIETRVEAFLDRCCPMDVALCLSCLD